MVKEMINMKRTITADFEVAVTRLTTALKAQGFGVLTRIDLDAKVKEKLGKEMPRVAILGACNPQMAYEAYNACSDVASLLPCNAVVRELDRSQVSIELVKPSALMRVLGDPQLEKLAGDADKRLAEVIEKL